jgi:hypothetical protein
MESVLARPTRALLTLWAIQVALGLGAYAARFHGGDLGMGPALTLGFPLAHRLTGALMLAMATVVTLQIFRLAAPGLQPDRIPGGQRVPA